MRNVCRVDGCEKFVHGRGYCSSHWNRWRRYGDPLGSKPRPVGKRIVTLAPSHPLAGKSGRVRRARLVLFEKLGGGDAGCHWCGVELVWRSRGDGWAADALCTDHLNRDTQDDEPANLVPACRTCNANRHRPAWVKDADCSAEDCRSSAKARGLCQPHYMRWWKENGPLR